MDDALRFADFEFEDNVTRQQNQRISRLEQRIERLEQRIEQLENSTTTPLHTPPVQKTSQGRHRG